MEENRKKPVMIGVIVACLVLAVFIWIKLGSSSNQGISSVPADQRTRLLCKSCGASWEMPSREYFKYIEDHITGAKIPPLPCKECGAKDAYRAVKCAKCGKIFLYGTMTGTFADQCPDCGYSQIEVDRKEAAAKKRAKK